MCGLAGFLQAGRLVDAVEAGVRLRAMTGAVAHRGPDAAGCHLEHEHGGGLVGLGHRRLSIIDLSEAGAQPMQSHAGRYLMAFNGEIYNFHSLRAEIEARRGRVEWRGHSDTEVLLELIADLGPTAAFARLDGMFALALYDREERRLTLARDAFGEKPLYYGEWHGTLLFGSELKALRAWPGFAPEWNQRALAAYFQYSYIPAPETIYAHVWKLPPACSVSISIDDVHGRLLPEPARYWDLVGTAMAARGAPFAGTREEACDELERVLLQSTRGRMVSDVPLGALLSGGIDSSLAVAMMQRAASAPVRTFTIGMDVAGYDEAAHARAVSAHLGTRHEELQLTAPQVQAAIPDIAGIYDEPFADSSQVPTFLVSRMARQQVTVALSGDGGDELFAGYNRYFHGSRLWDRMARVPLALRNTAAAALRAIPPARIDQAVRIAGSIAPAELAAGRSGEKAHKLAGLLSARTRADFHERMLRTGASDVALAHPVEGRVITGNVDARTRDLDFAPQAMLLDSANYLPDDVLTKVDRASMAVALEVRTPYLNRDVFELAWRLPMAMKLEGGVGKSILRQLLYRHVPRALVDRPKAGFAIPVGPWLRGPLRDWAESLLAPQALHGAEVLHVDRVRRLWADHLSGRGSHETLLWSVLMFQGWRAATAGRS